MRGSGWQHLETLGIAALRVTPDPVKIATDTVSGGALIEHHNISGTLVFSDDASQFRVGRHELCWVRAESQR